MVRVSSFLLGIWKMFRKGSKDEKKNDTKKERMKTYEELKP
jgi:hypothetical protein